MPYTFENFSLQTNVEADYDENQILKISGAEWHVILGRNKDSVQHVGKLYLKAPSIIYLVWHVWFCVHDCVQ